ncbi:MULTISPECIES: ABC transporter substrate-binding protein [Clostridium]|uniref:ABC transporter substrate-binding protein n=1 Tax=Clostridium TaxID=1485 RepID=UPI000824644C|nr:MULTISPECIES: ABC transporter substrate-binding protein [Clostridium]PJI06715.1 amino acid ABC transporter substrate-binding protein [Clostridium sp. CT7]
MLKKLITMTAVLCMCVAVLAGCGQKSSNASDDSLNKVKKAGVLAVGMHDDYPPMEFRDENDKRIGFEVDLANEIGEKMGVKIKFVSNAWDGIFLALNAKKYDVIMSTVSITDERKKKMLFSDPIVYGGNAVYVKSNNTSVKNEKDFPGKIIGCEAGSTGQDVLTKISGIKEVKKYSSTPDAFLDLKNDRIAAIVTDPMVGDYYSSKEKGKYKKLKTTLTKEPIGAAFRKNDKALRDAFQKAFNKLKKDGTLSKLSQKWFGYNIYSE